MKTKFDVTPRRLTPFNTKSIMKQITASAIVFLLILGMSWGKEFSSFLILNTSSDLIASGSIISDPPIEVECSLLKVKSDHLVSRYKLIVKIFPEPTMEQMEALSVSILPKNSKSDPIGFGTVFAQVGPQILSGQDIRITLRSGVKKFRVTEHRNSRIVYQINSGGGYLSRGITFSDADGFIDVPWEGTFGPSSISFVEQSVLMKAGANMEKPRSFVWKFTVGTDLNPTFKKMKHPPIVKAKKK